MGSVTSFNEHEDRNRVNNANDKQPAILLIDDDVELGSLMSEYFDAVGFRLESVPDGREGLARALSGGYQLVILDGMLPVLDGLEVLRQLRRRSHVPVIMLTARTAAYDRIAGLDMGADDYLPKPFNPGELLARVRALLRRMKAGAAAPNAPLEVGPVRINPMTQQVWKNNEPVELTGVEFDILDLLIRSAGRVVSRDEIAAALYQREASPFERAVDVHIAHLRKKLDGAGRDLIRTVRGVGYVFSVG
jgi:two-component system, OmpR family, response regulator CpxR